MTVPVPADSPVTMPEEGPTFMIALPVLHAPPPLLVRVIEDPAHTLDGPTIADGSGLTVTGLLIEQPVPNV